MEKLKQKLSDMFDNQTLSAARNYLRKEKPKQTDTDANITVRKAVLGDNDFNVERDGGPSYLPPKYNSEAANAERDGVRGPSYSLPKYNSAAANAERDGGPSYLTPKFNSARADAERDGKRVIPKEITDKVKNFGFTPGTSAFERAEEQLFNSRPSGKVIPAKKYAKGGSVSASSRGDGIAQRGKTKGRMC